MSLKQRITDDMKAALRAKDRARLDAVRMLLAAIQRREVDERSTLDDPEVIAVIEKLVKQGRESVDQFRQGARQDLVDRESAQMAVWQSYLPAALGEAEVEALIETAIARTGAATIKDMGKVIAELRPKLAGRADMAEVSGRVRQRLAGHP